MSKIDLTDVTFTIPIKIDSPDRSRNFIIGLQWILDNFDTNIIVFESDTEIRLNHKTHPAHKIKSYYHYSAKFHRTRYLNEMAKITTTPIIVNQDVDVMFKPSQILKSVEKIRNNELDGVFPYNGDFIDMSSETIQKLRMGQVTFDSINRTTDRIIGYDTRAELNKGSCGGASVGGCVIWDREKFIEGGMENENFISYGFEDNERVYRFETLGYKLGRVDGDLYHMSHSRGKDSFVNHDHYESNHNELKRVMKMDKDELKQEIGKWSW